MPKDEYYGKEGGSIFVPQVMLQAGSFRVNHDQADILDWIFPTAYDEEDCINCGLLPDFPRENSHKSITYQLLAVADG